MTSGSPKHVSSRYQLVLALCAGLLAPPLFGQESALAQEGADPALQLFYSANAAYNRKLFPIAAVNYRQFLGRYGTHKKAQMAHYGLGLSYFAMKQYKKAIPEFQKLIQEANLDPKIVKGRLTLLHAQCLLNLGQKDEAQARLIAAASNLKEGVHRTGATAAVADLFFGTKDWEKTLVWAKKLQSVKASKEQLIRAGYQEGFALYKLKRYPEAITSLGKTKTVATEANSKAWVTRIDHLLSECHVSSDGLEKAEAALKAALAGLRGTAAHDAQYRLGTIKFSRGKWLEAEADFKVFLIENKKTGDLRIREAQFLVARCLMEQSEAKKADQRFVELAKGTDEIAARAILWRGRLYSRNEALGNRYALATGALRAATETEWYKKGFPPQRGQKPTTIISDIDFEYANALMLQKEPDWALALKFLQSVQRRSPNYSLIAEVFSQQAICLHKLKQYDPSFKSTTHFLATYAKHNLIGDVRFLRAENLFLLNKLNEATEAYNEFLTSQKGHANQLAAQFRIAQIHHHQGKWAESNTLAVPLLATSPEGRLFNQLSFVVGENYFRQAKWAETVEPFEAFLETYIKLPKAKDKKGKTELTKAPNVDTALMQLGVAYARLGKKEEAIDRLTMLVTNYSTATIHLPLALSEQGKLLYETGDRGRARQALTAFVTYRANVNNKIFKGGGASGELGRVHYYLGWINVAENKHLEAAKNFQLATVHGGGRKGKDGSSLGSDAALQQGIALVNAKDFENAAKHLQQVDKRFKEHPRQDLILYYTGLAYARIEKWPQAAAFFKRVIEEHPEASFADKAVYEWAWCERSQKRNKQATEHYDLLLEKYPASDLVTKVQSELAELNLDVGAQDAVIAKLTDTLLAVKDPKLKFELQYQLASAHFKKNDYENSAKMFEALIPLATKPKAAKGPKLDPSITKMLPSILFQAGESRLSLTETAPARDHFLAAHKIAATSAGLGESILMRLAETQNITGQHAEAEKSYTLFIKQYPQSQWLRNARYGMAYAMEKQELYTKAIGEYAQLLTADPKKPLKMDKWMVQGRYQIGECYFNMQKYDKAMAEFVSVDVNAQGYPDWQAKAVLEMGRILLSQDKKSDAISRMKEVLNRFPKTKAAVVAQKYLDELRSRSRKPARKTKGT